MKNKFPKFFFLWSDDTYPAFDIMIKNKMIQNNSIKIRSKNTQDYRFFVVNECCRQGNTHTRQRHGFSKLHMKIFIHDLCYNIKSAGRSISVKKNTESHTDYKCIAQNIQLLTVCHRTKIREDFFKKSKKNRKHDTGVDGFYTKFSSAGKKADDQKYYVQNHGDGGKGQRYKVGKYDTKTRNTADRSMAWYQKKIDCRCNNSNSCCQDQDFQQNLSILQLFFHVNSPYLIFYGWEDPFLILMAF